MIKEEWCRLMSIFCAGYLKKAKQYIFISQIFWQMTKIYSYLLDILYIIKSNHIDHTYCCEETMSEKQAYLCLFTKSEFTE
jgi:hypothetical protein